MSEHEQSASDRSESRVDEWYRQEFAWSEIVAGLRGDMAVRAVSRDKDGGPMFPVLVEPDELEDYEQVDASEVPDWAREHVEDRFKARTKNLEAVTGVSFDD